MPCEVVGRTIRLMLECRVPSFFVCKSIDEICLLIFHPQVTHERHKLGLGQIAIACRKCAQDVRARRWWFLLDDLPISTAPISREILALILLLALVHMRGSIEVWSWQPLVFVQPPFPSSFIHLRSAGNNLSKTVVVWLPAKKDDVLPWAPSRAARNGDLFLKDTCHHTALRLSPVQEASSSASIPPPSARSIVFLCSSGHLAGLKLNPLIYLSYCGGRVGKHWAKVFLGCLLSACSFRVLGFDVHRNVC